MRGPKRRLGLSKPQALQAQARVQLRLVFGSGFGVSGSSLGLGSAVLARLDGRARFGVWGSRFKAQGAGFRLQRFRLGRLFKVQSAVLAVQVLGFGVWC